MLLNVKVKKCERKRERGSVKGLVVFAPEFIITSWMLTDRAFIWN
jgi:hypothetical protein